MVINTSEEAIEIHYAKCVGQLLKQFGLVKNDTDFVTKTDNIDGLPYSQVSNRRGVWNSRGVGKNIKN